MPALKEIFGRRIEMPDGSHLDVVGTPSDSDAPSESMLNNERYDGIPPTMSEIHLVLRTQSILNNLNKMRGIPQVTSDATLGKGGSQMRFVVRYAADLISHAMTSEELATALAERRLLPEMLFSVVGTAQWQPLAFVTQNSCWQSQYKVTLVRADYTLARVMIACGIVTCLAGILHPAFLFVGSLVILCGFWNVACIWGKTLSANVLKLLDRIAENSDPI